MRWIRRSTIWGCPALLGVALLAFDAAAQAPGFMINEPPTTPASAPTAEPTLEQAKRAAQSDAADAARDNAKGRAEIARERLAAQADAQAANGRGTTKSRAAKAADSEKPPAAAKADSGARPRGKATKSAAKPVGRQPTPAYRKLRDSWLAPVVEAVPTIDTPGRIPLVLSAVNLGISVSLTPQREDGGFDDVDLQRAASAFAPRDMQGVHPIAPRLLDLVYRAMRHFEAPMVHIISGYRKDRAGSRHTQGRAIDMALPGIDNEALAEYVRAYGFCGVGIYPKSGFVHLDVRDRSYFWVDNSMPGERSRTTPIMPDEALAADREASARGEAPDTYVPDNDAEDRAAARAYARRAKLRRERARREAARAQQRGEAAATSPKKGGDPSSGAKPATFQRAGML